jgi:hypothetical protein
MLKRIILEDWQNLLPAIALGFAFAVFMILTLRAIFMKREKADRMARLPLEKDQPNNQDH